MHLLISLFTKKIDSFSEYEKNRDHREVMQHLFEQKPMTEAQLSTYPAESPKN